MTIIHPNEDEIRLAKETPEHARSPEQIDLLAWAERIPGATPELANSPMVAPQTSTPAERMRSEISEIAATLELEDSGSLDELADMVADLWDVLDDLAGRIEAAREAMAQSEN